MRTKIKMLFGVAMLFAFLLTQQVVIAGPPAPADTPDTAAEPATEVEEKPIEKVFFVEAAGLGSIDLHLGRCGVSFPDGLPYGSTVVLSEGDVASITNNQASKVSRSIKIEIFDQNGKPDYTLYYGDVYCNITPSEAREYFDTEFVNGRSAIYRDGNKESTWFQTHSGEPTNFHRLAAKYAGPGTYFLGK